MVFYNNLIHSNVVFQSFTKYITFTTSFNFNCQFIFDYVLFCCITSFKLNKKKNYSILFESVNCSKKKLTCLNMFQHSNFRRCFC